MRTSRFLLSTVKETPADAEVTSHRLMIRSGMIRKVAAGIYSWLPLGLRVLRKVESIVRQEMDKAGAQELLMPAVQPAELWQESGRWDQYGPELLRFHDRHAREFCFGPTHEEVITDLVRRELRSYRQLPANFYQIQMKFRDEIRPRFGVMRAREFLMKDAYSFHVDSESLQQTYDQMYETYCRIFKRTGLEFRPVEADSGSIGGNASHEFHVLADSGEDSIAICTQCDYAANVEQAQALLPTDSREKAGDNMETVDTPGQNSIEDVSTFLNIEKKQTLKTLLVEGIDGTVALVLRGDHELNEIKAGKLAQVATPLVFVTEEKIKPISGSGPGSIGPVNLSVPVIADNSAAQMANFVCGANKEGKHLRNVNWGRDLPQPETADLRNVVEGDACPNSENHKHCSGTLSLRRGIEVGHIFQLGTRYSQAMKATVLDANGKSVVMAMGCYGIGVSRLVAAAIEQHHDDNGIIWPDSIAPFQIALIPIGYQKSKRVSAAIDSLYDKLTDAGFDVLLDDGDERPGVMFAQIDLIGIPHRLVLGEKGLDKGVVEYKKRGATEMADLPLQDIVASLTQRIAN